MRLEMIQGLQFVIIAFLSYVPTVVITGWFEAWVAKKCGDDTPEQFGFLTFDPMAHFNIVGFGCLLAGKLLADYLTFLKDIPGWGRYIPMIPNTTSTWRIALQFNARAIMHFILTFVALVGLGFILKAGYQVSDIKGSPTLSSGINVLQFFLNQNLVLCMVYFAIGLFRTTIHIFFPEFYVFSAQYMVWSFFIFFLTMIFYFRIAQFLVMYSIIGLSYLLSM